jgi:hypothetical protein
MLAGICEQRSFIMASGFAQVELAAAQGLSIRDGELAATVDPTARRATSSSSVPGRTSESLVDPSSRRFAIPTETGRA